VVITDTESGDAEFWDLRPGKEGVLKEDEQPEGSPAPPEPEETDVSNDNLATGQF